MIDKKLELHYNKIKILKLKNLFSEDQYRAEKFSLTAAGLFLDYSKNRITEETIKLLLNFADEKKLDQSIQNLFAGKHVNFTEDRPALHMSLREPHPKNSAIKKTLEKMENFYHALFNGTWTGFSGKKITDIINLGIGGSDLGPRMVIHALKPYHNQQLRVHCVANIDGTDLFNTLESLNPETTLFIVASKTFTTIETLTNALTAREWVLQAAQDTQLLEKHFVAVTSKPERAVEFGMSPESIFEFWDWVGGRFSLWSAIGLPIMLATSPDVFKALLKGANGMDEHFQTTPFEHNMPVILGLLTIWYVNYFNAQTQAIIPYDEHLKLLPNYLQQLIMESNGQHVDKQGHDVTYHTSPVIWGDIGTNGQHAFHQLLHQGTLLIPIDFIIAKKNHHPWKHHHDLLFSNCLAQSQALMEGKTAEQARDELIKTHVDKETIEKLIPHKVIEGNKPNNIIMMEQLTPETLGALIALYEHRVFVEATLWNINPFAQYGVELGKQLANTLMPALQSKMSLEAFDSSTQQLIKKYM